jgi:hypothetical protein
MLRLCSAGAGVRNKANSWVGRERTTEFVKQSQFPGRLAGTGSMNLSNKANSQGGK